jgi:hypothetical protein
MRTGLTLQSATRFPSRTRLIAVDNRQHAFAVAQSNEIRRKPNATTYFELLMSLPARKTLSRLQHAAI